MVEDPFKQTEAIRGKSQTPRVRTVKLSLTGSGGTRHWTIPANASTIGSHPSNAVEIDDPTVSRFHCEIIDDDPRGILVRDLKSTNGTILDGVGVNEGYLRHGSRLLLGRAELAVEFAGAVDATPCSPRASFGPLIGGSTCMRQVFTQLERAAQSDVTVLVTGETGTGKEAAAEAIHQNSQRADGPFVVVDLSAIHPNLIESELFGHERGAFTGATAARAGAFEQAHGGTIFLDELGELPLDLQPRLLRVLEKREVRRVGQNEYRAVDVRVIAATHRDLRTQTNEGKFRSDLYYRLAVVCVRLPALRERMDDLPQLVENLLTRLGASASERAALVTPAFLERLRDAAWPGNVRELRNHLERCYVMGDGLLLTTPDATPVPGFEIDPAISYHEARKSGISAWERRYLEAVFNHYRGSSVAAITRAIGIDRHYFYRLLRRHRLEPGDHD